MNRIRIPTLGLALAGAACARQTQDGGSIIGDSSSGDEGSSSTSDVLPTDDSSSGDEVSSGGDGLACQTASAGAGIAYVGVPEAGVWCDDELCELGCEFNFDAHCQQVSEGTDYGTDVDCDGPEDCANADVCCQIDLGIFDRAAECMTADACDEAGVRVCNTDAECDGGACVRGWSNQRALDLGVCQSEPASACTGLPGGDCSGVHLRGVDLIEADLVGVDFCRADLSNAWFDYANLSGAVLTDADLSGARLSATLLAGADFRGADLTGAELSSLTMPNDGAAAIVLAGAALNQVVLDGCDLSDVDLHGSLVLYSSLRGTDLSGADLRDAVFSDVDLTGADLTGAQLDGIIIQHGTCPDGTPAAEDAGVDNACEGHLET
jgi:uncharacterized protein YjbI with pentapeptide repeats